MTTQPATIDQLQAMIDEQCLNHVFTIQPTPEGFLRMQTLTRWGSVATDGLYDAARVLDYFIDMGNDGANVFRLYNDRATLIDLVGAFFGDAELYK